MERPHFPRHDWHPVTHGMSGDEVWRLTGPSQLYAKHGPHVRNEALRIEWLGAQGIPAPELVNASDGWLVTAAVRGRAAHEPWPAHALPTVVDSIAEVTRRLHSLDANTCPFNRRLTVTVAQARSTAAGGRVALDELDAARTGWSADQLVAELDRTRPASEDLVVCHGDLCLPNVLIDPKTFQVTGLIDLARLGVADRYVDLAIATRSMALHPANTQFGPAIAGRFLARYGVLAPDAAKIAFYRLLDEFS